MSSFSSPAQTKRCQYCGAAMVLRVSKSDKNRGKPFWKCLTSYGATSCNGFEWVDVTSAEADQQADMYSKQCKQRLKQTQNPLYSHFSPLAVLKSFHSKNISMNSKHYTTVGGKRRKHLHLVVPQAFIPELAWFIVMLYVATQSSEDLFRMASVCPLFNTLANTPQVWNTISMEKYQDHPNWYYASTQVRHFMDQCRACENPEVIFREAFDLFFRQVNVEALSGMRVAATVGHMEAAYLVGLLGMCGIGQSKEDALEFLCSLNQRNNIDMKGIRDALRRRLRGIFSVERHIVDMFHYGKITFNQCSACNNNDWCFVITGWPSEDKINPAFWNCCNRCKWPRDSVFWFKVMRVYVVPRNPYPYNEL